MGCETLTDENGHVVGFICAHGRSREKCWKCGRPASLLCDYPVGEGKTCDKPLCRACAIHVGHDRDYCPDHPHDQQTRLNGF